MRILRIIVAAAALVTAQAASADGPMDQLDWIVGAWATEGRGPAVRWTEERWAPARGGVMLGTSLTGRADKAAGFEFLRIAADEQGVITYWASPDGRPPVPFRLVSSEGRELVFINPDHDYPQRIVYLRTGYGMTVTISGKDGANPQSWRFKRLDQ